MAPCMALKCQWEEYKYRSEEAKIRESSELIET
jgi:hypothetical protein